MEADTVAAEYDIAVVGGGASGLAAAIAAAREGARVCVLEAQQRVGKKLLATGNGRCNITNSSVCAESYRTYSPEKVKKVFEKVSPEDVRGFLENTGISLSEEEEGRMYPRGGQAASVLDMLRFEIEHLGIKMICEFQVDSVSKNKGGYFLCCKDKKISAEKIIFANGSKAAPQLGGSDSGIHLLKELGHSAVPFRPSLVPLKCSMPVMKSLKGVRVRCQTTLIYKGKQLYSDFGEVQFGDMLLSGIVVFQLSSRLARAGGGAAVISLDLMPDMAYDDVFKMLINRRNMLEYLTLENFLSGLFNKRIGTCLIKSVTDAPLTEKAEILTTDQLEKLTKVVKSWSFTVQGPAQWQQAQVASGGITLSEFDDTLQSKFSEGIYACGELLDCDGDCGGFNLHWAWTSGILAGRSAAEAVKGTMYDKSGQY